MTVNSFKKLPIIFEEVRLDTWTHTHTHAHTHTHTYTHTQSQSQYPLKHGGVFSQTQQCKTV